MGAVKYKFDPESATFKPIETKSYSSVRRGLAFVFLTAFFAFLIFIIFGGNAMKSDNALAQELEEMKFQYELLDKKMNLAEDVLADLEKRDNHIYRSYFELEEIPGDVRKSGFGGTDRYGKWKDFKFGDLVSETSQRVDVLTKQLEVQSRSFDQIKKVAQKKDQMFASLPAIQPISNKDLMRLASGYGMRLHPILKIGRMHWGVDFKATPGTPIYATGDAVVKKSGTMGGYGNVVVLDHGFGYETLYAHMLKQNVSEGQKIKRGDVIGYVGNSGLSSGPHLHYEVHKNGEKVDPINYFYQDVSPDEFNKLLEASQQNLPSFD